MIFMSDLDRTLIYSNRSFGFNENEHVLVDKGSGNYRNVKSGSTKETISLLKEISNYVTFIPNTARNFDQLVRLNFEELGVDIKYASILSGKIMLENDNGIWTVLKEFDTTDKSNGVNFFREYLNKKFIISGGDNLEDDLSMLKASDYGYFLETYTYKLDKEYTDIEKVDNKGLLTSNDYLQKVHNKVMAYTKYG